MGSRTGCTHLRKLPQLVDRLVVQAKASLDTISIVCGLHALDLRTLLITKAVAVQVVDVCHVNSILKHTPVIAVELNLTCKSRSVIGTQIFDYVAVACLALQVAQATRMLVKIPRQTGLSGLNALNTQDFLCS